MGSFTRRGRALPRGLVNPLNHVRFNGCFVGNCPGLEFQWLFWQVFQ